MRRRKLLAGLGSLAAGGAAVMGTGAFETAEINRDVSVNVAADSAGFVEIQALNEKYASGTGDGELALDFNSDSDLGIFDGDAQGLNPDSVYEFPEVFKIANVSGTGDARVAVDVSGFQDGVIENVELTAAGSSALEISEGTSLRAADYDDVDALPKLVQPDSVDVDVEIETQSDVTGAVSGTFTILFATGGNREELSDDI
jgi:hypothetical protein